MEKEIELKIIDEITDFGYMIADIKKDTFEEMDITFEVISIELLDEINDYNFLLKQEKEICNKLNLYEKNIVLAIV